jgi:hypothetical protein
MWFGSMTQPISNRLLIGTIAQELTDDIRAAYGYQWLVETNFYGAQARV